MVNGSGSTPWQYMNLANEVSYLMNVPYQNGATFTMSLNYSTYAMNATMDVYLNNQLQLHYTYPYSKTANITTLPFQFKMGSGLNVIKFISTTNSHGPFTVYTVQLSLVSEFTTPYLQFPPKAPCPTTSTTTSIISGTSMNGPSGSGSSPAGTSDRQVISAGVSVRGFLSMMLFCLFMLQL